MQDTQEYADWQRFAASGLVSDYLRYRRHFVAAAQDIPRSPNAPNHHNFDTQQEE